jgi:uncharacterized cupredoxin-like copper-binding protein
MRRGRLAALFMSAAALAVAVAFFWPRGEGGSDGFGSPGDRTLPARSVEILIRERPDGRMYFLPDAIEVRGGEQVRLVVKNEGERLHTVLLGPAGEIVRVIAQLRSNPRGPIAAPNAVRLAPGETGEVFWHFTRAGELEFSSVQPGDREAGLYGRLVVR